ncbi:unnamed protein product [Thlaspi arvense]|uniref:Uncharacterized protein n=1 Tax=Thlaspi arvense TaxID=13288 RepID=A0AAU9RQH8_THLAR|nr:unnamed protein product [Thlaspi arvense]
MAHFEPSGLPTLAVYSPYILREEAVLLGVELSLYVAEAMFLLCDDISSMLIFCSKLWRGLKWDLKSSSPVVERLLRVIHLVYSRNTKPKNEVYQIGGKSAQGELMMTTLENFDGGMRDLHKLFLTLQVQGSWADGRELTSSIEEMLKKVEEKLRCANGFVSDVVEPGLVCLWKTLLDKETEETWTREEILIDLFQPLIKQEAAAKH